jgi:hypothetical protein
MKALKCDVCGGYFDSICTRAEITETSIPNKINIYFHTESERIMVRDNLDICPDCYKAIKKALDDRRKIHISDPNDDDLK